MSSSSSDSAVTLYSRRPALPGDGYDLCGEEPCVDPESIACSHGGEGDSCSRATVDVEPGDEVLARVVFCAPQGEASYVLGVE